MIAIASTATSASCNGIVEPILEPLTEPAPYPRIAAGAFHTCALDARGSPFCWGRNDLGQLGTGDTVASSSPVAVAGGVSFVQLVAGPHHTCGLDDAGNASCWGQSALGNASEMHPRRVSGGRPFVHLSGGPSTCGLDTGGVAWCWQFVGSDGVVEVEGERPWVRLASGRCAIVATGQAFCWDRDQAGVGFGPPTAVGRSGRYVQLSRYLQVTCGVTTLAAGLCWSDSSGERDEILPGLSLSSIVVGNGTSCALDSTGSAHCWGRNDVGQVGDGSVTALRPDPTVVLGGHAFTELVAGGSHTCGSTPNGSVLCWGQNSEGQLGDGTNTDSSVPVSARPLR